MLLSGAWSAAGHKVKVPAKKVQGLQADEAGGGHGERQVEPVWRAFEKIVVIAQSDGQKRRCEQHGHDGNLTRAGRGASPVPTEAIPPEGRCDLDSHRIGWMQITTASESDKIALAGGALQSLRQTIGLQDAAVASRTGVGLAAGDDLLPK